MNHFKQVSMIEDFSELSVDNQEKIKRAWSLGRIDGSREDDNAVQRERERQTKMRQLMDQCMEDIMFDVN